jgi:DNA (cytosine-5)-methyltransferase 1
VAIRSINILSLCSGIGGLELGIKLAEPRARTVCYVEWEAYAAATLVARMADKTMDSAPIWDNVKTFDSRPWCGVVDCIMGGYPCQPFSVAGKRKGTDDPRHLWPHVARIVGEVSPAICFFENVPNHLNIGFQSVCEDLWGMGYRIEAGIFSAAEVGAPHLRKRLFIMAYRKSNRRDKGGTESTRNEGRLDTSISSGTMADPGQSRPQGGSGLEQENAGRKAEIGFNEDSSRCSGVLADPSSKHIRIQSGWFNGKSWPNSPFPPKPGDATGWTKMPNDAKPAVRRDANGPSSRVDRLRCIGNAVVPQVAALAWHTLMKRFIGSFETLDYGEKRLHF